ncbi:type II toxin-antitoxin system VapC family toxin [Desulfatirhabdium butyrativorans]|uniref:type II toxin-antitoxin system VapC family toxin n=1 Tax=Desulfatirhabdium butyrativorans TaxID=340467 RepID=UPI000415320A|nr:type II toxin-antitoxin system VapC family toxin [Desulfatirhabdium butyrativorans]
MENILIDTDIVIEYLRNKDKSSTDLIKLMQDHDLFLSSITEFELYLGAKTASHQKDLEMIFSEVDVIPFDFGCGKIAADIWKDIQSRHQHLEIKDIFIASIAIRNGIWLHTFNKKHFLGIENLQLWDT